MTLRRLLLAPLFALALLPAFAATVFADEPLEVEIVHVDGERGITTVFLSVFGEDGRSIDDLEPTDFSVNVKLELAASQSMPFAARLSRNKFPRRLVATRQNRCRLTNTTTFAPRAELKGS